MTTKKYQRKIVILGMILLAFGVLLYLQNLQKQKAHQQLDSSSAQAKSTADNNYQRVLASLPDWDSEEIAAIAIDRQPPNDGRGDGRGDPLDNGLDYAEEASHLELERPLQGQTTNWKLRFPEGIPVQPQAVQNLGRNALYLGGKKLQGSFDLKQETSQERYGFHQTWLTIAYFILTASGEKELRARVLVGSEIPGIGGYYVTVVPGQGPQGSIPSVGHDLFRISNQTIQALAADANALRNQQLPQVALLSNQQEHLQTLELRSHSNVMRIEYKNEELEQKYSTLNELQSFVMTKPYPTAQGVDQYQLEKLLKTVPNPLRIMRYTEDSPKDLAVYGLDEKQRQEIYASDNIGRSLKLWLGREANKDSVYAMEAGYDSVFTVDKQVLRVLNFEPFQIVDKFMILVNIARIDRIRLLANERSYNMQILHKAGSDEQDKTAINGSKLLETKGEQERSLGEDVTKDLYQEFLSIFFAGEVSASFFPVDKPEVSMIYLFRDGRQRRADFYNYSAKRYYVVSIDDGKVTFVTEKRQLDQLLDSVNQVLRTGQLNLVQ